MFPEGHADVHHPPYASTENVPARHGHGRGGEERCSEPKGFPGAGHEDFSIERARRALAGGRNRLPMPRVRESEALALAAEA